MFRRLHLTIEVVNKAALRRRKLSRFSNFLSTNHAAKGGKIAIPIPTADIITACQQCDWAGFEVSNFWCRKRIWKKFAPPILGHIWANFGHPTCSGRIMPAILSVAFNSKWQIWNILALDRFPAQNWIPSLRLGIWLGIWKIAENDWKNKNQKYDAFFHNASLLLSGAEIGASQLLNIS